MSFIPAGIGADLRALVTTSLGDRATNSRTGRTRDVRVSHDTGRVHVPSLTPLLPFPRWFLTFEDDDDVKAGDTETVTGEAPGVYTVLEVIDPGSLSVATKAIAVLTTHADGSSALPVNQTVQFRHPSSTVAPITADVYIESAAEDIKIYNLNPEIDWKVVYAGTLRYADATKIRVLDEIVWSELRAPGFAALSYLVPFFTPLQYVCAYFEESP